MLVLDDTVNEKDIEDEIDHREDGLKIREDFGSKLK